MKLFKSSVYFAWLFLFFPSFLLYGEVENSSSYHQDSRITPFSQNILSPEDRDNGKLYTTNILLARNEQTIAGKRRANRKKRKHTKKSVIQAEYESCKNKDLSSLALKKERTSKITEGEFCFTCFGKSVFGFSEIKETIKTLQSKAFKEKLQKRVIGQIESKLFQVGIHKACIKPDRKWFDDREVIDWPLMKHACVNQKRKLKSSIQSRWSKMRVNLSLISPSISESRIVTDRPTWFDSSPSHHISSFKDTSLPKLTAKEKKEAEKLYINKVSEVSLEHFSEAEFKEILLKQQSIPGVLSGGDKYITGRDQSRLRKAVEELREEAKSSYFQAIEEQPVLAYLERSPPRDRDLEQAFSEMERKLKDFLEEAKDPEADMGLLLSFKPLVEEILREEEGYCLVAEEARIEAEKDESFNNWLMVGVGALAAIPCFISGPIGASICLAGGMGIGIWGYEESRVAREESLGRALTGSQFETIAGLSDREREEFLAKLFLPLGAWGTTAVPARAASKAITGMVKKNTNKVITNNTSKKIKGRLNKEKSRLLQAYNSILRSRPAEEQNIIMEAIIGMELKGMNKRTISEKVRRAIGRCNVR